VQFHNLSETLLQLLGEACRADPNKPRGFNGRSAQRDSCIGEIDLRRDVGDGKAAGAEAERGCGDEGLRGGAE